MGSKEEWAGDVDREQRLKLKLSPKSQGTVGSS